MRELQNFAFDYGIALFAGITILVAAFYALVT